MVDRQAALTRKALDDEPQIWHATGLADLQLVQLLLSDGNRPRSVARLDTMAQRAGQQYAAAFARGASLREVASIRDHLDFLLALTADQSTAWSAGLRGALQSVRRAL